MDGLTQTTDDLCLKTTTAGSPTTNITLVLFRASLTLESNQTLQELSASQNDQVQSYPLKS